MQYPGWELNSADIMKSPYWVVLWQGGANGKLKRERAGEVGASPGGSKRVAVAS